MPENFKISQDVTMYPLKEVSFLPVSESDWEILKEMIKRILPAKKIYGIIYSACFGISGSAFLSLIPNAPQKEEPFSTAFIIYLCIAIAMLVIGIVTLIFDYQQKEYVESSSKNVLDWMESIKQKVKVEDNSRET